MEAGSIHTEPVRHSFFELCSGAIENPVRQIPAAPFDVGGCGHLDGSMVQNRSASGQACATTRPRVWHQPARKVRTCRGQTSTPSILPLFSRVPKVEAAGVRGFGLRSGSQDCDRAIVPVKAATAPQCKRRSCAWRFRIRPSISGRQRRSLRSPVGRADPVTHNSIAGGYSMYLLIAEISSLAIAPSTSR